MRQVKHCISNAIDLESAHPYAAILGSNPSRGARSPLLWNAVFETMGEAARMVPMDVAEDDLQDLLQALEQDRRFMGGAIAFPHKETACSWLAASRGQRLSTEAQQIGAVNCLYRDERGRLCGTNTDGEGALTSLRGACPELAGSRVLLLGPGGAGKAVAAYVASAVGEAGALTLSARNPGSVRDFAAGIGAETSAWPPPLELAGRASIVINCTPIGSGDQSAYTPLAALSDANQASSARWLQHLEPTATVFDIIYDPAPSSLLVLAAKQGLRTLDGGGMNLEQAVLAFNYAQQPNPGRATVHSIMESARRRAVST